MLAACAPLRPGNNAGWRPSPNFDQRRPNFVILHHHHAKLELELNRNVLGQYPFASMASCLHQILLIDPWYAQYLHACWQA
jgi:hypothetical protein